MDVPATSYFFTKQNNNRWGSSNAEYAWVSSSELKLQTMLLITFSANQFDDYPKSGYEHRSLKLRGLT